MSPYRRFPDLGPSLIAYDHLVPYEAEIENLGSPVSATYTFSTILRVIRRLCVCGRRREGGTDQH